MVSSFTSSRLAQMMLVSIFAGFFFYHTLAAFEIIPVPLPLGGWWSFAQSLAALVLGLIFLWQREFLKLKHAPFITLCAIVLVNALWHWLQGNEYQSLNYVLIEHLKLLIAWSALYLVGYFISWDRRFSKTIGLIILAIAITVPFLIQTDPFSPNDDDRRRFLGEVANYHFFANSVSALAIFAVAYGRTLLIQSTALVLANISVFLIGSRAETMGMLIVTVAWFLSTFWSKRQVPWRLIGIVGGSVVVAGGVGVYVGADAIQRYADILNFSNSASWKLRSEFLKKGVEDIFAAPFFGHYVGQMEGHPIENGYEQSMAFGVYLHNFLEIWRSHGIVPFALFTGLCVYACWSGLKGFRFKQVGPDELLLLLLALYTTALAISLKSIYWPMPALAWGVAISRLRPKA